MHLRASPGRLLRRVFRSLPLLDRHSLRSIAVLDDLVDTFHDASDHAGALRLITETVFHLIKVLMEIVDELLHLTEA